MARRKGSRHRLVFYLPSAVLYFAFSSVDTVFGQTPNAPSSQTSESEEILRLNEKIAAQADKIAAQAAQLAAQQTQINALQIGLAEQKALVNKFLQANRTVLVNQPSASLDGAGAVLPSAPPETIAPAVLPSTAPETVALAVLPSAPQETTAEAALKQEDKEQPFIKKEAPAHWYDRIKERGYMQFRENNIVNTNRLYICDQCDKSIGPNNGFFLRRMRLVIYGDITDHLSFYIQSDFASASGSSQNYAQLRDAYFDVAFDSEKTNRVRVGLSKIPYGFDNMQSSQNRLDFDRDDAINSAQTNERDIGVFYYWAPPNIRARFAELVSSGLKGSGDYGEFGAGIYNGQGLNTPSANSYFHYVARYTYPFKLKNGQFIETSIQGYTGKYTVTSLSSSTITQPSALYNDQRLALSLIVYPQPWGLQTEYNWGTGPQYKPQTKYIQQHPLNGGYVLLNYRARFRNGLTLFPYGRFTYYNGGKKFELDARKYLVVEGDFGLEVQIGKYIEPTIQYQYGDRTFQDGSKPNNRQLGSLLRLQLQFNY
ncbi:MAG: hypothetical protein JOY54_18025 [Acidobacteriaceae bacterium]|nr:hypothetical protein [Acidobacteriaceae bacterium]